ncbi:MAG TPA: hypothetical protein VEQ10_03240, partial [Vicinamibacteria bacterium]|nr:hypothetical protein [Vicinamibacteria bacterium]
MAPLLGATLVVALQATPPAAPATAPRPGGRPPSVRALLQLARDQSARHETAAALASLREARRLA